MLEALLSQTFISLVFFFHFLTLTSLAFSVTQQVKKWRQLSLSWVLEKDALGAKYGREGGTEIHSLSSPLVVRSHSWDIWHTSCKYFWRINSTCGNLLSSPLVQTVTSWPFLPNRDLDCFLFRELCIYNLQRNPDDSAVWECSPSYFI